MIINELIIKPGEPQQIKPKEIPDDIFDLKEIECIPSYDEQIAELKQENATLKAILDAIIVSALEV